MSRKYALIIGNKHYLDPVLSNLKTHEADIHALTRVLSDPSIGGFDEVTELLDDQNLTIRQAIANFYANKKPDDLLLFYFSGHVVLDENERLHLAVKDTERSLLAVTSIPATFINEWLDDCRSRRKILILDCVYSGTFARGAMGGWTSMPYENFKGNALGRVMLVAPGFTQYALEGDQAEQDVSLSLLTNYLVEGLATGEADKNHDGWIDITEWYDYVREKILIQTPGQVPLMWAYNIQGDLIIASSPKGPQPASLPEELKLAVQSPFVAVRADAVEELKRILLSRNQVLAQAAYRALQELVARDDSKRIVDSACSALTAFDPMWNLREPEESPLVEKADDEQLSREKAEQERLAAEKAEAERLARGKAEAERLARQQAEGQRLARQEPKKNLIGQAKPTEQQTHEAKKSRNFLEWLAEFRLKSASPSPENLKMTVAYPRRMAKGFDTPFIISLYPKAAEPVVMKQLKQQFGAKDFEATPEETELTPGIEVSVELSSNSIDFKPEKIAGQLLAKPNLFAFLGKPKTDLRPGVHSFHLLITDTKMGYQYLSKTFNVEVVDYAFDHISRPLLTQAGTVVSALFGGVLYLMTFLEQIDNSLGLTTGTAAWIVSALLFALFYGFYRKARPNAG